MERSAGRNVGMTLGFLAYLLIFLFFITLGVVEKPVLGFDSVQTVLYGVAIGIPLMTLFLLSFLRPAPEQKAEKTK